MPGAGDKLKILWVSHLVPYPPKGGVLMRSNYLSTELARHHEVHLLALNQRNLLKAYYGSVEEGLRDARQALAKSFDRIDFIDLQSSASQGRKTALALKSLVSPLPYSIAWLQSEELKLTLQSWLADGDYDLVHFDTVGLAPLRACAGALPTILDHHNVESHMMLRRAAKESNLLKKIYFYQEGIRLRQYEKRVLADFDGHITCSDTDSQRLREIDAKANARAIPNSVRVDENFIPRFRKEGKARLLFIGGLDWYPNRDAILHFCEEVWPELAAAGMDLQVDIVGKNPCEKLKEHVKNDSRIRLHGFVDDINDFYRESDIFICPIRDGGGTKLKVLDAMSHYQAVVGYPEAFEGLDVTDGENALVVNGPKQFASKVLEMIRERDAANEIGRKAHDLICERYEAKRVGELLGRFYAEVVDGRERSGAGKHHKTWSPVRGGGSRVVPATARR